MDILRRLFGMQGADPKVKMGAEPHITAPGAPVNSVAPAAVVQQPSKRSTEEINESATLDPTPVMGFPGTRQLPPLEQYVSKPGKHVVYGLSSDIGLIRTNNQDSMYAFFGMGVSAESRPDFGLFIVADGMGGHHDGELASAIAVRIIGEYVLEKFYLSLLKELPADADRPIIGEVLSEAVQKANRAVSDQIPEGGTTVTAAALLNDLVYIAHVGDSRAYLVNADGIEQMTRDHSLVQRLIELDQLTPEEAASHPQRNVLYRAIGQSENLEIDAVTRRLAPGSRLMLCSDGLWNQIGEENLHQIIQASKNPQEACDHLVTVANDRGGPDNITVLLVQIPG